MVDETQEQTTEQTSESQTTEQTPSEEQTNSSTQAEPKVDLSAKTEEQTEETQQTEEKSEEELAREAAHAELFGAPEGDEGYTIEGLPEGMEIDKEALDAVTPTFKELGLSNKGAAKVAQVYAEKVLPGVMEAATKQIETQVIAQRSTWEQEAEAAIKANGQDLKNAAGDVLSFDAQPKASVMKTAAKALDHLAPEGFREFLADTGLAQHPMMVAFAYQAGKSIAEDTEIETTDAGTKKPKSQVERFYGPSS